MEEGVGDRVRQRREELDKSQDWLAEQVGVTQPAVAKLEKGGPNGTRDILAYALALDVSPVWLKTGKGPKERDVWMDRITRLKPASLVQLDTFIGYLEEHETE